MTAKNNAPFEFTAIRVRSVDTATPQEEDYRVIYPAAEAAQWFVDIEWKNGQAGKGAWEAKIEVNLVMIRGEQGLLVARGEGVFQVPVTEKVIRYTVAFQPEGAHFDPGTYRIQVIINGQSAFSEEITVLAESRREELYELVGLRSVKEELTRFFELAEFVRMRRNNGFNDPYPPMNMLFTGSGGTGKSTVAGLVGQELAWLGVLANGQMHRFHREELSNPGMAPDEALIRAALKKSGGGVFYLEDAEAFYPSGAPEDNALQLLTTLFSILENEHPPVLFVMAGERNALSVLYNSLPDMKRLLPTWLDFPDYTGEELAELARRMLNKREYSFQPKAEEAFIKTLGYLETAGDWEEKNGHLVARLFDESVARMAKRLMAHRPEKEYSREEMMLLHREDIPPVEKPDPGKAMQQLESMIYSGALKQDIRGYIHYVGFLCERKRHGFVEAFPPLNMIFAGHPGTGKVTVARMMAEVLQSLRVLDSAGVQVREPADLTGDGSYPVQQFALYAYEQARGGILYIRNTQKLLQDTNGAIALNTILGQLSETEQADTILILGGIAADMERFLSANPRVKVLFPYFFRFEDYTPEQLYDIALQKIREKHYTVHAKAAAAIREMINRVSREQSAYYGNALFVDKLIDKAIRNLSERTMKGRGERELTRRELTTLMEADIPVILAEFPGMTDSTFDEKAIAEALRELDRMVGQQKMKKQVHDFVNLARHYKQQGVKLTTRLSLQWCFTGNSGMGKGTVARILACLYKAMGLIEKNQVYRLKAERLIGLGEEEMAQSIGISLMQSKGGLFFFDEDSPRLNEVHGLKERLRAMLLYQMTEQPGSYTVIYADQNPPRQLLSEEVERISDMVNILTFEDYSRDELMKILKLDLASEQFKLTRTAEQHIQLFVDGLLANKTRNRASARLIKLVAEMMIRNRIQRLSKEGKKKGEGEVLSITRGDVAEFTPELLKTLTRERNTIGY